MDEIVLDVGNLFKTCAERSFGYKITKINNTATRKRKPWYNSECRRARNNYHYARKVYNKQKTEHNKNFLKCVSKTYKETIRTCLNSTKLVRVKKLRSLKSRNPKEYWKILNSENETNDCQVPINELHDFFKELNGHNTNNPQQLNATHEHNIVENKEINESICENEIRKAINQLRNNKSSGVDEVKNEHIKATSAIMLPIYTKLFNLVFDTGIIPESWTLGVIKPIYKSKGDPKMPENYRPITILSCLGKLFTLVINNRLKNLQRHMTS